MTTRHLALSLAALPLLVACGGAGSPDASAADGAGTADPPTTMGATLGAGDPAAASPEADPAPAAPPAVDPSEPSWVPMPYRGVNLAGAEFGGALPGVDGIDYRFPTPENVDYYLSKGMNTFRIGFKWERLQPVANGDFEPAYAQKLDAIVAYATSKGARVILNPHNFARYYDVTVGSATVPSSVFADLWSRLATHYGPNPRVLFNLVNEPHDMPTEQWVGAANAAIAAIRGASATNVIIVPGNAWTGAHSWAKSGYGTPNAVAMLDIVDPIDNVLFEAHQYLDADAGGKDGTCMSTTIGSERLKPWIDWLRANKKKGFVGELAGGENATCFAAIDDMAKTMMENADVVVGWLWWAGGPKWGSYKFSLEPRNGADAPYMARLAPYLAPLTARATVTSKSGSDYCADVEVYDWAGKKPLAWMDATIDLRDGAVTSVSGGALSGATGTVTATPAGPDTSVPLLGNKKLAICASLGASASVLSVVAATAK
jgi:endoglucanase